MPTCVRELLERMGEVVFDGAWLGMALIYLKRRMGRKDYVNRDLDFGFGGLDNLVFGRKVIASSGPVMMVSL